MKHIFAALLGAGALMVPLSAAPLSATPRAATQKVPPEVSKLVAKMTVDEEISQLQSAAAPIPHLGIRGYNWWNEGLHGLAREGYATVFPQAIALAATWDVKLLGKVGAVVSTEARAKFNIIGKDRDHGHYQGLTIWSPNINIFRDPRWGRGQETYGEDPFLTGTLATAFVRGIQGPDPAHPRAVATLKHFAVHSGPEGGRHGFDVDVSPYDFAATYSPAFRKAVRDGGVLSVMCSYNALRGTPACAARTLLTDTLRRDWGFSGYVVTDCDAVEDMYVGHFYRKSAAKNAAAALKAGTDLNCGIYYRSLRTAYDQHLITKADLDRSVTRLFAIRRRLGMDGIGSRWDSIGAGQIHTRKDKALALRAAREAMVLLKNNGVLPLKKSAKLAVIGPNADTMVTLEANYHGTAINPITPLIGLSHAFRAVRYAQGTNIAKGVSITIPRDVLHTGAGANAAPGLTGAYFDNATFSGKPVMTRVDAKVSLDLNNAVPVPALAGKPYAIRWHGFITPPAAGDYQLRVTTNRCWRCNNDHDRVRLFLDGKEVIRDPADKLALTTRVHFSDARPHALRLDFAHVGQDLGVHLQWQAPAKVQLKKALAAVQGADAVVAFVGLSPDVEGEELPVLVPGFDSGDRTLLKLPARQLALLKALKATGKKLIVVNMSGGAVALDWSKANADAILQAWYPGESGGTAIAEVLDGAVNPSGKLPVTVYASVQDLPAFVDYRMTGRTYRYFTGTPLYGFGYGLSYTAFRYDRLRLPATLAAGKTAKVSVRVTNTGKRAGDAVAELYLTPPENQMGLLRSLAGLRRVHLKAGESRVVHFTLAPRALSKVQRDGTRVQQPGTFGVFVGGSQPGAGAGASAELTLTGKAVLAP